MAQSEVSLQIEKLGLTKKDIKAMAKEVFADDEILTIADEMLDEYALQMEDPNGKMIDRTVVATRVRSAQQMVKRAIEIVSQD